MAYPKLTPIVAAGTTEPRYVADRFADVVNVKDYGAKGDNTTNDVTAIEAATVAGDAYMPAGFYSVSSMEDVPLNRLHGKGTIKYAGHRIAADGALCSDRIAQRRVNKLKFVNEDYTGPIFEHAGNTPQGMCFLEVEGIVHIFTTTVVQGNVLQTGEGIRITEWIMTDDGSYVEPVAFSNILTVGHGQDISATFENGIVYLWTTSPTTANGYGGQGITKIEWKGSETSSSDVTTYAIHSGGNDLDEYFMTPCVSHDGKLIIFCSKLLGINDCRLVTVYSKNEYISDPTIARPLYSWMMNIAGLGLPTTLQGLTSDGKYIYTLHGEFSAFCAVSVQKWDLCGNLVKNIPIDPLLCSLTREEAIGKDTWGGLHYEPEGLEVVGDKLYVLIFAMWRTTDVVTYDGKNYSYTKASSNSNPKLGKNWELTERTATAGAWDKSAASYSMGTVQRDLMEVWAIQEATGANDEYAPSPYRFAKQQSIDSQLDNNRLGTNNDALGFGLVRRSPVTNEQVFALQFVGAETRLYNHYNPIDDHYLSIVVGTSDFTIGGQSVSNFAVFRTNVNKSWNTGSNITIYDDTHNLKGQISFRSYTGTGYSEINYSENEEAVYPNPNNHISLGNASNKWREVFSVTGAINTSDERLKDNISDIEEAVFRAWGKVRFKVFQFKDAVQKKGELARLHVGVIAQHVDAAFKAEGLDAGRFGLFCYDEWQDSFDHDGNVSTPAGNQYSIRYEEALALECAYQRWRLEQLEERVNQLTNNTNN